MSPRAAARLESLGFTNVYDYEAGKADWFAAGLPREGEAMPVPRAADVARNDDLTCALEDTVAEAADRARAAGQDRKDRLRVPISSKLVADLLVRAGAHRIMTMDLHASQIQGFFDVPHDHLYSSRVGVEYLASQYFENLMIVSPDAGGVERARAFATHVKKNQFLLSNDWT